MEDSRCIRTAGETPLDPTASRPTNWRRTQLGEDIGAFMTFRLTLGAFVGAACLLTATASSAGDDAVSALLKLQTQAFSDAGQRGDMTVMARYLDADVLFTNEDGSVSGRRDLLSGGPAATQKGISQTITVTNWVLHRSGDVAVAGFVDDQVIHYHGQVLNYKYRSTETWIKRGAAWKMIASQTIALQKDPPTVILPSDELNDYVGTYAVAPGFTVRISRNGNALASSTNGGKTVPLEAEVRDVFFTPGLPRTRKIFRRDASGHVTGYVGRREGRDLVLTKLS
jgi:hypothetical protein